MHIDWQLMAACTGLVLFAMVIYVVGLAFAYKLMRGPRVERLIEQGHTLAEADEKYAEEFWNWAGTINFAYPEQGAHTITADGLVRIDFATREPFPTPAKELSSGPASQAMLPIARPQQLRLHA